jgi:hypothetical protein
LVVSLPQAIQRGPRIGSVVGVAAVHWLSRRPEATIVLPVDELCDRDALGGGERGALRRHLAVGQRVDDRLRCVGAQRVGRGHRGLIRLVARRAGAREHRVAGRGLGLLSQRCGRNRQQHGDQESLLQAHRSSKGRRDVTLSAWAG